MTFQSSSCHWLATTLLALGLSAPSAFATAPIDPNPVVVSGQVGFSGLDSPHAVITQESLQAIVDYHHFNVLPGGSVQFIQPGSEAAILNRITGADPSSIAGAVSANGQVYFVNPAGVTFGAGSVIRADTFLAAAGQVTNEAFLSGNLEFSISGTVANFGTIETSGLAGLLGRQVLNAGEIVSREGVAVLSSGDKVYLQPVGSSLVVEVAKGAGAPADGVELENTGVVSGNDVLFSAGDAFAVALSHSGSVTARESARFYSDSGVIDLAGEITVPGGRVEVGGTDHGGDGAPRAIETRVAESARIDVSAETVDQRGHLVIWGDELTTFRGSIRGEGIDGGDGAFVEISAAELDMGEGIWDISLGQGGHLLFDPLDILIDAPEASNIVTQMNAGTNVTVDTNSGTWGSPTGTEAGDIFILSPIAITNGSNSASLTLNAARDIVVNANVRSDQPVIGGTVFSFNAGRDLRLNSGFSLQAGLASRSAIELNAPAGAVFLADGAIVDAGGGALAINVLTGVTLANHAQILSGVMGSTVGGIEINAPEGTMYFGGGDIVTYGPADVRIGAKRLTNNTGSHAISTSGGSGNWQIALPHPHGETSDSNPHTYGGLLSGNHAVFNSTGTPDPVRNEYHYSYQPMIRVEIHDGTKTYGDTTFSVGRTFWNADFVNAASYDGVFEQDTYSNNISGSLTLASDGRLGTASVGSYAIVPSGLSSANGYGFNYSNGTLTVTPRSVTLTAMQQDKIYGDSMTLDNTAFTVLDKDGDAVLPNGESIDSATLTSRTGMDTSTTAGAGTYSDEIGISAAVGSNGFAHSNYAISYVDGDLVVDRRAVSLTALEQAKIYGDTLTLDGTAFSILDQDGDGVLPNGERIDTVTINSRDGLDTSTAAHAGIHIDELVISDQSGSNGYDAGNYTFSYVDGPLLVNRRPITLTALSQNKDYGDTLSLDGTHFSLSDLNGDAILPNGEQVNHVTVVSRGGIDASTSADAGSYTGDLQITGQSGSEGFSASNYVISYVDGELVVDPRAITVAASQQQKDYGDTLTLDFSRFTVLDKDGTGALPNGELIASATLVSQTGMDASTTANAGVHNGEIRVSAVAGSNGFAHSNYAISYVDGDLVVGRRAVTLTALEQAKIYGDTLILDGTAFSILDQDGDGVLPNGERIDTVTINSRDGLDTSTAAHAGIHIDELVISDQSGSNGYDAANYTFSYVDGPLLVNRRPITLTALSQNKDYGDTLSLDGTHFSLSDLNGDAILPNGEQVNHVTVVSRGGIDASTSADAGSYAGDLQITGQSGSEGFSASNYVISYVDGELVVDPRAITVAASQQQKDYGDALTLDFSRFTVLDKDGTGALPNGELIASATLVSQTGMDASTTANAGVHNGEIRVSAVAGSNGFAHSNYAISYVDGDLVVGRRAITLTALEQAKIYGDVLTPDGTAFRVLDQDGGAVLPNGESIAGVAIVSVAGNAETAPVGSYLGDLVITGQAGANGFDAANYAITYKAGDLAVTPRPITLAAHDQERLFYNPEQPDPRAFAVIDADGDSSLPNGEQVHTVTISSKGGVAGKLRAAPGVYQDNLVITGQLGSNGFNPDNYLISYLPGELSIQAVNAPVTLAEAFAEMSVAHTGADARSQLSRPSALDLTYALLPLFGDPKWNALGESQRAWWLREIDRWSVEQITWPLQQQLLNEALLQ